MNVTNYLIKKTSDEATWISKKTNVSSVIMVTHYSPTVFIVHLMKDKEEIKYCPLNIMLHDTIIFQDVSYDVIHIKKGDNTYTLTVKEMISDTQIPTSHHNDININISNSNISNSHVDMNQGNNSNNTITQTPPSTPEKHRNILDILRELWNWLKDCPLFKIFFNKEK